MNFGNAFSFIFDDANWFKKIIIPTLVGLIPVIGQMVIGGYIIRTIRNVANKDPYPLPEMDFGEDLRLGFGWVVVGLVYSIPMAIVGAIMSLVTQSLEQNAENPILIIASIGLGLMMGVWGLIMAFFLPAAQANYAVKDKIGAAFNLKEVFGMIFRNPVAWLLVLVGTFLSGLIAPLGIIACGVGVLLTTMYASLVNAHLSGQAYSDSQR